MKISYNWLKQYLELNLSPEKIASILTGIGLEVESIEMKESIPGGLEGFVVGEVVSCVKHPNAQNLSLTQVNTGTKELLSIVCGAPNVAAGQKVIVATVGATIYSADEPFKIKKSKIRGEVSEGMICAEDELGIGEDHSGILILESDAKVGLPARNYFNIENDYIFEIGLTPNRIDAASHYGVARDLAAYLSQDHKVNLKFPDDHGFSIDNQNDTIKVSVKNPEACIRYTGITISGLNVTDSPDWLQKRLKSIGQKPINNVVDITNFILHEMGQPLHAFDRSKIIGNQVIVQTLQNETPFICLDESEKKLSDQDLMICNAMEGMCIAGVFGGLHSGVTRETTSIFLESACFNPVSVRKTARRHGLNTDSSFRFERGTDPNITVKALKRAAALIREVAGGTFSSEIIDLYPNPVSDFQVYLSFKNLDRLIGNELDRDHVKQILKGLEIKIDSETKEGLHLLVPPYRVDVQREADVIEEILRIFGYNFVQISHKVQSTISHKKHPDSHQLKNLISDLLSSGGFNEMMCNSLSKADYYKNLETFPEKNLVSIHNPLSQDLNVMRQTLIFGGLETIAYNSSYKNADLKLYEFGNSYSLQKDASSDHALNAFTEEPQFGLFISGKRENENWITGESNVGFYDMKAAIEKSLKRVGAISNLTLVDDFSNEIFSYGLKYHVKNQGLLAEFGEITPELLKRFEINEPVFAGIIHWNQLLKSVKNAKISYSEISRFPVVRRDLAMIADQNIRFSQLADIAMQTEKKILKEVNIFDVYQGENIPKGKKSYALSFFLQDDTKTLNDKHIEKIMSAIASAFERELQVQIRS